MSTMWQAPSHRTHRTVDVTVQAGEEGRPQDAKKLDTTAQKAPSRTMWRAHHRPEQAVASQCSSTIRKGEGNWKQSRSRNKEENIAKLGRTTRQIDRPSGSIPVGAVPSAGSC